MDRLSMFLTFMTGSVLTGGLVIFAFSLGLFNWTAILICAAIGFILSWPTGYVISRLIKKNDPGFDHTKVEDVDTPIPKPGSPEV